MGKTLHRLLMTMFINVRCWFIMTIFLDTNLRNRFDKTILTLATKNPLFTQITSNYIPDLWEMLSLKLFCGVIFWLLSGQSNILCFIKEISKKFKIITPCCQTSQIIPNWKNKPPPTSLCHFERFSSKLMCNVIFQSLTHQSHLPCFTKQILNKINLPGSGTSYITPNKNCLTKSTSHLQELNYNFLCDVMFPLLSHHSNISCFKIVNF